MKFRTALIALATLFVIALPIAPASAEDVPVNEGVCAALDSGKIDVTGSENTVTITAPEGYLIDNYCVKAGSIKQGDGPEYVTVDPPVASLTISHSTGKDISHYSFSYVAESTPTPTPTETSATPTPTETSATPTPTETTSTPIASESPLPSDTPSDTPSATPDDPQLAYTGASTTVGLGLLGLLAIAAGWALLRRSGSHS